jgi:hypothetical protein
MTWRKREIMDEIHSCSLYCDRPECIKAQRDELRDKLAQPEQPEVRTGNCLRVGVCASEGHKIQPQRTWVGLTDEEQNALIPESDGSAEANVMRVEVLPGVWGQEYEEVDAWSKPLVLQILKDHEAKLRSKNT